MFDLNKYMIENRNKYNDFPLVEKIKCVDGFSVSAQASKNSYCSPRIDCFDNYTEIELGYPSEYMGDEFVKYCENKSNPTDTVYAYVPVKLVEALIYKHGGIVK